MNWTPDKLRTAIVLRRRGFTYARTGEIIGATKNEVIGKLRRLRMAKKVTALRAVMPQRVKDAVIKRSWELGYDPRSVLSPVCHREISHARQEVMRTIRSEIIMPNGRPPSYPLIGKWFGRDHSTVVYGVRSARERANVR